MASRRAQRQPGSSQTAPEPVRGKLREAQKLELIETVTTDVGDQQGEQGVAEQEEHQLVN